MEKSITISDAEIKTATIEVKVIKIGNKQVTLAVFRQLPEEPIIHPDTGGLCGIPWGRVNYHIDCESYSNKHMHVVWQKDNELRRSVVAVPWIQSSITVSESWERLDRKIGSHVIAFIAARILEGWIPDTTKIMRIDGQAKPYIPSPFTVNFDSEYKDTVYVPDCLSEAWWFDRTLYQKDRIEKEITDRGWKPSSKSVAIKNYVLEYMKLQQELRSIWQQSYSQLEQLDQLFIAV